MNQPHDVHDEPRRRAAAVRFVRTSLTARYTLVTLGLFLLTCAMTWPHVRDFGSTVLGAGGDVPQAIRLLWALDAQGGSTLTSVRDHLLGAPEGTSVLRTAAIAAPIFNSALWIVGQLFGWVVAINTYNLVAFVLSGTAMFILLDRLSVSLAAAAFGTFAFTFNPNHVEKLYGAAPLTATGVLPLLLLALIAMRRRRTVKRSLLAGGVLIGAFYLDPYLGLFAAWLAAIFAVVDIIWSRRDDSRYQLLRSYYIVATMWIVGMIPVAWSWAANNSSVSTFTASRRVALPGGSATWQTYLLPGPRNPWFGGPMRDFLPTRLSWEPSMFIGYTTMLLAVAGVVLAAVRWRRRELGREEGLLVVFAIALVVTALIASLPETVSIFGIAVPTPQRFILRVTEVYRVYSRFGVLVGFGTILLAVYALTRVKRKNIAVTLPLVALVVVAAEFYVPRPDVKRVEALPTPVSKAQIGHFESGTPVLADLSHPPAYVTWLRAHGSPIVADYPNPSAPDGRWAWKDIYQQYNHHLALWQIAPGQVDETGTRDIAADLKDPRTPGILASQGVRFVVVHPDRYHALHLPVPGPICGLKRAERSPDGTVVYRVTADGEAGWVARAGFESLYNVKLWPENLGVRWMHDRARVTVFSQQPAALILSAFGVSLNRNRTLSMVDDQGNVVTQSAVSTGGGPVKLPFNAPEGRSYYTLVASPGQEPRGQGDPRSVSVALQPFTLLSADGSPLPPARCG